MAATMAILPAPLFFRALQEEKNKAMRQAESYHAEVRLSEAAGQELQWWMEEVQKWNGRSIWQKIPDLTIELDASLLGWGAIADG